MAPAPLLTLPHQLRSCGHHLHPAPEQLWFPQRAEGAPGGGCHRAPLSAGLPSRDPAGRVETPGHSPLPSVPVLPQPRRLSPGLQPCCPHLLKGLSTFPVCALPLPCPVRKCFHCFFLDGEMTFSRPVCVGVIPVCTPHSGFHHLLKAKPFGNSRPNATSLSSQPPPRTPLALANVFSFRCCGYGSLSTSPTAVFQAVSTFSLSSS